MSGRIGIAAVADVRLAVYIGCFRWIPIGIVAIVAGIVVAVSSGDGWLFVLTASSGTMLGYAAVIYAVALIDHLGRWPRRRQEDRAMWLILLLVGFPVQLLVTAPVLLGHGLAVFGAAVILTTPALLIIWVLLYGTYRFFTEGE